MSILTRIQRFFSPSYQTIVYGGGGISAHVDDMDIATLYAQQPQLRTVVSFLASNVAQLPLKTYIRESDTSRRRDTTSRIARLIAQPNRDTTTYELIYSLMSDLKLYDIALWVVAEDATADSGYTIRSIPPAWISGYDGGDLFSPSRVIITNPETGRDINLNLDDCILWHGYDPTDPRYGLSAVRSLKQVLKEQLQAWSYRSQVWERGSRIPAYISRPVDAEPWDDEDMERFRDAWQDAYAKRGHGAGSTPVLEDGMTIKSSPSMSMQDAQWEQANLLSLQTVCGVYHLKPSMISDQGQTYASVKENARALYTDTLGPDIKMIEQRLARYLVQRLGADPRTYIEFDLAEKLNGSFMEQVQMLQSSVGAPWITRNEARAMVNRQAIDGGDDLIVPLNVIAGGLASPRDTTEDSYAANAAYTPHKAGLGEEVSGSGSEKPGRAGTAALGAPLDTPDPPDLFAGFTRLEIVVDEQETARLRRALERFFSRQEASVLSRLGAKAGEPDWYDAERWDRELSSDLNEILYDMVSRYGADVMRSLAEDESAWSAPRTAAYVRAVAEARAHAINQATLRSLMRAIEGDLPEDDEKATPKGVFDYARTFRAVVLAEMLATSMTSWAAGEAARQAGRGDVMKTWVVMSGNPRDTHAAMAGETVGINERFSNGAMWPGDTGALDVDEVAGCQCRIDILIP